MRRMWTLAPPDLDDRHPWRRDMWRFKHKRDHDFSSDSTIFKALGRIVVYDGYLNTAQSRRAVVRDFIKGRQLDDGIHVLPDQTGVVITHRNWRGKVLTTYMKGKVYLHRAKRTKDQA